MDPLKAARIFFSLCNFLAPERPRRNVGVGIIIAACGPKSLSPQCNSISRRVNEGQCKPFVLLNGKSVRTEDKPWLDFA
jgi:hypothetical protein